MNLISEIQPGAFDGLPYCDELSLNSNALSSIIQGSFRGLANLDALNLQRNSLKSLVSGVFISLLDVELDCVPGKEFLDTDLY